MKVCQYNPNCSDFLQHFPFMTKVLPVYRAVLVTVLIVIFYFSYSVSAFAASLERDKLLDQYAVTYLTAGEGLPSDVVDDMLIDSRGFLWIGLVGGGLVRYDGYEYLTLTTMSPNTKIKGNFIHNIAEDAYGQLWIVSDGGLDIISLDSFKNVTESVIADVPSELINSPAPIFMMIDGKGRIWITNREKIICMTLGNNGKVTASSILKLKPMRFSPLVVKDINGQGEVWASIEGKICSLTEESDRSITAHEIHPDLKVAYECVVWDFLEKDGDVWIACVNGLIRYNKVSKNVSYYVYDPSDTHSLSQNCVTSLAVLPDNTLIVGTLRGLNIYDSVSDNFSHLSCASNKTCDGINCDFVNCMTVEKDCLWVGTEGGGVNMFSPRRLLSQLVGHDDSNPHSMSVHPVNSIFNDENGDLWIGSVEGGLSSVDEKLETFRNYTTANGSLTHNSVSAIVSDCHGGLWVGTWGGGLNHLSITDPSRALSEPYTFANGQLATDFVGALAYDPYNNLIWVGTSRGVHFISIATGEIREAYPSSWEDCEGALGCAVTHNGELWIGGEKGLVVFDLRSGMNSEGEFSHRVMSGDGFPHHITYILESRSDESIFIATNGSGLFKREIINGEEVINSCSEEFGANLCIIGLAFDIANNLWLATNNGVICQRNDGNHLVFGEIDDVAPSRCHFYWNASMTLPSGDLIFGMVNGILRIITPHRTPAFHSLSNKDDRENKVAFTRILVDHEPILALSHGDGKDPSLYPKVRVHQSVKTLGFEFSSLDYAGSFSGHYEYRLKGFEKEWISLPDDRNYISYTNLPSGNYDLELRYIADGHSAETAGITVLPIEIIPYFYNRGWFISLMVVLTGILIFVLYRIRLQTLIHQRQRLKNIINDRTKEIENQKDLLQMRADDLSATNEELRQRNDEIEQQKEYISEMSSYVQRINLERLNFFTNITHEFRTPITLIMGPISRALKLSTNPQVIEQLSLVERNSKYLLSLVNQLMDFRRIESGKMEIMLSSSNIIDMIEDTIKPFHPMASERQIAIDFLYHIDRPIISHDEEATRKVLINFLANALKFTPEGGRVTVYLSLLPPSGDDPRPRLYLAVSDTGSGIPKEDLNHVFDKFYQGHTTMRYPAPGGTTGSGIGLYLCQQILEMYGGSISVVNNHNGIGCTFRTIFPVTASEETPLVVAAKTTDSTADYQPVENSMRQTILVVEDNADMRTYIKSILRGGYDILEAENGRDALVVLHTHQVDFIITDLMMPVMDGAELARRVKSDFEISHIPILVLTAKTAQSSRIESYRVGVEEYLLKPFDEKILITRIRNILDNKRRYQQQFNSGMKTEELNMDSESRDKRFMDQVMEVLKSNYKNSHFDVGDFAEALGVSRTLLNNKLTNLAGQSAVTLIRSYRMTIAKEMIMRNRVTRRYNISEIAYEVGFNDSKYFTRCFTRHFGIPPSAMMAGED